MAKKNRPQKKMSLIVIVILCICIICVGAIFGDRGDDKSSVASNDSVVGNSSEVITEATTAEAIVTTEKTEVSVTEQGTNTEKVASTEEVAINASLDEFDINEIPDYNQKAWVEVNNDIPYFTSEDKLRTDAFETYSDLDPLGRCGVAYANICPELLPTEERGKIGSIKPSGWHTVKYSDLIADNYLYNRCHLIAHQLASENANEKNLITGTRYMNTEGMLMFEEMVGDYVRATSNHVLYRVTPVFGADNLVATGVLMEAWSVEDNGAGICFNVFCYNVQPGIIIDYATGDSKRATEDKDNGDIVAIDLVEDAFDDADSVNRIIDEETITEITTENTTESVEEITYVLNKNTHKFHYSWCSSVSDMKAKNRLDYEGTRDAVIGMGYEPCKRCNP